MKTRILTIAFVIVIFSVGGLFAQTGTISGTITDAKSGDPLALVNISVKGTLLGTSSRNDGTYSLTLPQGSYEILIQYVGYTTAREKVNVVADETLNKDFALEEDVLRLSEIVVTGTRRADRTVVESPVPIDILPAKELKQTGLTETNQIVEMLVPSFNFPRPTINDGTDHIRPATLRGLNPDQTLVLINGKRRHSSALLNVNGSIGRGTAAVDLNSIPPNAIERIEVLRDGAAAQYGSDAIAGVINVILKSDAEATFTSTLGQTSHGDGETATFEGNYGYRFGDNSFINLSGEVRHRNPTNRAGLDPRQQYFSLPDGSPDPREFTFNRKNHRYGDAEVDDFSLFANSAFSLSGNTSLYAFGNLDYRNGESGGFYRRALDNRTVRAIYPDGFLPIIESKILDASIAAGLKGTLSDWIWDLSTVYGRNAFEFNVNHSANVSLGTNSPTSFDAGTNSYQQSTTSLDVLRDLDVGLPTPLSLALGAVLRVENYQIDAGEQASWINGGVPVLDGPNAGATAAAGSQVFPGFRPSDERNETRTNVGVYADLETNLTETFFVGVAGRFENYSDFGSTVNGKLSLRFEPVPNYALRGAISSGFRAPSLMQSFYSTTATVFIDGEPFEIRTFPVDDPAARALGSKDLDAEKSINVSAGVAMTPVKNLAFTADYYHIEIDDRIALSENFTGQAIIQQLEAQGIFGVTGGRFFTNAIDTKTNGIDLILRYVYDLQNLGRLRFTAGANFTDTNVTRVAPNPPQLASLGNVLFGRREKARVEEGQPKNKINLMLNYDWNNFSLMVRTIRFGEFTTRRNSEAQADRDQTFGAKWITDLDIGYDINQYLTLGFGGTNIFDVFPDKTIPQNSFNGIFPYPSQSPFGFNGAYYYARLAVHR